ncbi:MAG: glycosyltransferase family 2 protein [Pseudomonadota bacterium]
MNTAPLPAVARVRVLILNWNGLDDTIECVESLQRSTRADFELHLIDNGSAGDDADQLEARFTDDARITVQRNTENLGFARGMNAAMVRALEDEVDTLVLLNNDTTVADDWLERLITEADESGAGIVASRMVNYFSPDTLDNAGHLWLNTGEILPRGTGEPVDAYGETGDLIGGCAGAVLFRAGMLREVGLFDPYFGTGYEDAEHGLRAFLRGYPTRYCPSAIVRHKVSQSIDKVRDFSYSVGIQKNINYTIIKLMPMGALAVNLPFIVLKTIFVPLTALLFGRWTLFKAHLTAIRMTIADLPQARMSRKTFQQQERIRLPATLAAQQFFLATYFGYFTRYMLTGRKTVFER